MNQIREIEKITSVALDVAESRGWITNESDIKTLSISLKRTPNKTSYEIKLAPLHDNIDYRLEFDLEQ